MNNTGAVICEFNPIHLGHKYILQKAREYIGGNGCLIAVMSGNFTERCTPAVYDKYTRANSAVLCGADLVVELPFPWCSSGVEDFARGGVSIAAGLHAQSLTFGSESGDKDMILRAAEIKASEKFKETILTAEKESRNTGSAAIFSKAMEALGFSHELGANDKLGMEYVISGRESGITDFNPIKRQDSYYSAKNIREIIFSDGIEAAKNHIAPEAFELYKNSVCCTEAKFNEIMYICARLIISKTEENPILRWIQSTAEKTESPDEFVRSLPNKKYTLARLRRELLFHILISGGQKKKSPPSFTVLLAANQKGREYLKSVKKTAEVKIITKPADVPENDEIRKQYAVNQAADRLYTLCTGEKADKFMLSGPVII